MALLLLRAEDGALVAGPQKIITVENSGSCWIIDLEGGIGRSRWFEVR